jgi:hypothetical protein
MDMCAPLLVLEETPCALVDHEEAAPTALEPRPAAHVLVRLVAHLVGSGELDRHEGAASEAAEEGA